MTPTGRRPSTAFQTDDAGAPNSSWSWVGTFLNARAGTIYHKRGSTASLAAVAQVMVERLHEGLAVAVFPEGGTGPGDHVRTFHARTPVTIVP